MRLISYCIPEAVGIERLQKIYLCLVLQNPTDKESVPKCLIEHNHHELEKEIEKYTTEQLSKNGRSLLGVFLIIIIITDMQIIYREKIAVS